MNNAIITDPSRNPTNFRTLFPPTENSSTITSDAEMYKNVPAEIDKNIASNKELIPLKIIPNKIPAGVVNEKSITRTIRTSRSILDLFKLIPYI